MKIMEVKKITTGTYNVSLQKSGGSLPVIVPENIESLSKEYLNYKAYPNKDVIRKALESGIPIDGCYLGDRGSYLEIK